MEHFHWKEQPTSENSKRKTGRKSQGRFVQEVRYCTFFQVPGLPGFSPLSHVRAIVNGLPKSGCDVI
jgi:hypothetical protein